MTCVVSCCTMCVLCVACCGKIMLFVVVCFLAVPSSFEFREGLGKKLVRTSSYVRTVLPTTMVIIILVSYILPAVKYHHVRKI